jgi:mRNA interferase YafQ
MREFYWSSYFQDALGDYIRSYPGERERILGTFCLMADDPFSPTLDTHKFRGSINGFWICSAAQDCRVVFNLLPRPSSEESDILLIDLLTIYEI